MMAEKSYYTSLIDNDKLETDFKKKAHHFNLFFASKCTPLINNSVLPDSVNSQLQTLFN